MYVNVCMYIYKYIYIYISLPKSSYGYMFCTYGFVENRFHVSLFIITVLDHIFEIIGHQKQYQLTSINGIPRRSDINMSDSVTLTRSYFESKGNLQGQIKHTT